MVASTGFDFPLLIDDAVQLAGGLSMTTQDVQNARTSIYLLLNSWSNRGYNTWRIRHAVDFTIPDADSSVALTRTPMIEDVVEARVLVSGATYVPLTRMSPAEFGRITNPAQKGMPARWYLERTDTPVFHIHLTGREGQTETVRLTVVERPAAFTRDMASVDAPARWLNAIVVGAALGVARRRPQRDEARIAELDRMFLDAQSEALGADRQRVPWRLR